MDDLKIETKDPSAWLPDRALFSVPQAAEFLGLHRITLYRFIKDGKIPAEFVTHFNSRVLVSRNYIELAASGKLAGVS